MSQAAFIVFDATTGAIKRTGTCPLEHLDAQARAGKNERVLPDTPRSRSEAATMMLEQKVIIPAKAAPYLRKRSASEIASRQPRQLAPMIGMDELLTVLSTKGVAITRAELEAARKVS